MAEITTIEWTDATFNPWWGCQKVSPACDHCYAERDAARFAPNRVLWGVGAERRTFGDAHWQQPLKWARQSFVECMACRWRGVAPKPTTGKAAGFDRDPGPMRLCPACSEPLLKEARRRVFCASMSDWLDLDAPLDEFVRLLDTIRRTPELDWLLLSKRIGNWRKRMEESFGQITNPELATWVSRWLNGFPPSNVWLGATVIDQTEADRDVPKLLATPARVRFLSIEPMLGPVDLGRFIGACERPEDDPQPIEHCERCGCVWNRDEPHECPPGFGPRPDWVICGGESGPHARPMHPDWARSLKQQCQAAGVPFFMKQMTKKAAIPDDLMVREFPHAA